MTSQRVQTKYDTLMKQYEAWMLKLNDLQMEHLLQHDPAARATLEQQIAQVQQARDTLEQQLDALEQQLQPGVTPPSSNQDIDNTAGNQGAQGPRVAQRPAITSAFPPDCRRAHPTRPDEMSAVCWPTPPPMA